MNNGGECKSFRLAGIHSANTVSNNSINNHKKLYETGDDEHQQKIKNSLRPLSKTANSCQNWKIIPELPDFHKIELDHILNAKAIDEFPKYDSTLSLHIKAYEEAIEPRSVIKKDNTTHYGTFEIPRGRGVQLSPSKPVYMEFSASQSLTNPNNQHEGIGKTTDLIPIANSGPPFKTKSTHPVDNEEDGGCNSDDEMNDVFGVEDDHTSAEIDEHLAVRQFSRILTPADGDCSLHAIIDQLKRQNICPEQYVDEDGVINLRTSIMSHILTRKDDYQQFILNESVYDYVGRKSVPRVFLNHVDIQACAEVVGKKIIIVQPFQDDIYIYAEGTKSDDKPLNIVYLQQFQHYQSLALLDIVDIDNEQMEVENAEIYEGRRTPTDVKTPPPHDGKAPKAIRLERELFTYLDDDEEDDGNDGYSQALNDNFVFQTVNPDCEYRLCPSSTLTNENSKEVVIKFRAGTSIIGSNIHEADTIIAGKTVSASHATIRFIPEEKLLFLSDNGSRNGTLLYDNILIDEQWIVSGQMLPVQAGQQIFFGDQRFSLIKSEKAIRPNTEELKIKPSFLTSEKIGMTECWKYFQGERREIPEEVVSYRLPCHFCFKSFSNAYAHAHNVCQELIDKYPNGIHKGLVEALNDDEMNMSEFEAIQMLRRYLAENNIENPEANEDIERKFEFLRYMAKHLNAQELLWRQAKEFKCRPYRDWVQVVETVIAAYNKLEEGKEKENICSGMKIGYIGESEAVAAGFSTGSERRAIEHNFEFFTTLLLSIVPLKVSFLSFAVDFDVLLSYIEEPFQKMLEVFKKTPEIIVRTAFSGTTALEAKYMQTSLIIALNPELLSNAKLDMPTTLRNADRAAMLKHGIIFGKILMKAEGVARNVFVDGFEANSRYPMPSAINKRLFYLY
uniref:FHA domain-containing protein n=1 Tax=Panagrolaimus superbus TaxID=310955 RepID=A0A914XYQ4_9BILA